jgi:hypothetical protein
VGSLDILLKTAHIRGGTTPTISKTRGVPAKARETRQIMQLSGTIIRGTFKAPNSQLVTPISTKLQGLMGAIKSGIGPFEGLDHASPEPSLGQGQPTPEDLRLAQGPRPATNTFLARPRPCLRQEATLTESPRQPTKSQEHLMQRWPDTFILTRALQSTKPK